MIYIRGPDDVYRIEDPSIRSLVEERLAQLGDCDPGEVVLVLVEQGDTLDDLEGETGLTIATDPFSETRYPNPDFQPIWEWALEHEGCWECAFVTSDSGSTTLFVPRRAPIDSQLHDLCAAFAEPALTR